jgi:hypothetical protein
MSDIFLQLKREFKKIRKNEASKQEEINWEYKQ